MVRIQKCIACTGGRHNDCDSKQSRSTSEDAPLVMGGTACPCSCRRGVGSETGEGTKALPHNRNLGPGDTDLPEDAHLRRM